MWIELTLSLMALTLLFARRYLPQNWRYLSRRKRRSVRLAVLEFTRTHNIRQRDAYSRIYKTQDDRCIVMLWSQSDVHPPIMSFYSIANDSNIPEHIGSGQCHWGVKPEDLWQRG